MKNILNKIEFHYTYLIMALSFILTGYFLNLIVFSSLIIIHEFGHFLIARLEKIKVDKIIIYPYGGITKLENKINIDINSELKIAISGVLVQSIYYIIIFLLWKNAIIRDYTYNLFKIYHYSILIFNLLPIYPLDGAKIMNLLLSKYFNFKLANKITVIISIISLFLFIIKSYYELNYSYFMVIFILLENIIKYYKLLDYIYAKFLLERYLYHISYNKVKIINNKDKMYKNYRHLFKINNNTITERNFLKKMFD